jgi:hypothetical protein
LEGTVAVALQVLIEMDANPTLAKTISSVALRPCRGPRRRSYGHLAAIVDPDGSDTTDMNNPAACPHCQDYSREFTVGTRSGYCTGALTEEAHAVERSP